MIWIWMTHIAPLSLTISMTPLPTIVSGDKGKTPTQVLANTVATYLQLVANLQVFEVYAENILLC